MEIKEEEEELYCQRCESIENYCWCKRGFAPYPDEEAELECGQKLSEVGND